MRQISPVMTSESIALTRADTGATPVESPSMLERLVWRSLRKFRHGGLRVILPGGETHVLGSVDAEVTAELRIRRRASFFKRIALYGNVGFGEAYVDGDWDTPDTNAVVSWFIRNIAQMPETCGSSGRIGLTNFLRIINRVRHLLRPNSVRTSKRNISEHYDLGNDFYSLWLDKTMTYSAARFTSETQLLEEAQWEKYEALCRMLKLRESDRVLEIGCGWGGFACHAAREHGCHVTAVTISREQFFHALERVKREGLADKIDVRLQDYRHIEGKFDKIASIEMLEAVGDKYLETYFAKCRELLHENGLFALQYITVPDSRYDELRKGVDWIQKHIFPGSLLLSIGRVNEALRRTGDLFLHQLDDIGSSYAKTLHLWWERFNEKLDEVRALGFDDRFIRKWNYYLQYCEAAFATRHISVVQACYTRPNNATLHTIA